VDYAGDVIISVYFVQIMLMFLKLDNFAMEEWQIRRSIFIEGMIVYFISIRSTAHMIYRNTIFVFWVLMLVYYNEPTWLEKSIRLLSSALTKASCECFIWYNFSNIKRLYKRQQIVSLVNKQTNFILD
jgi:hypothetical protein